MSFLFRTIDDVPAENWDTLVRSSPDGWVFGLHGWQRLVTAVEAWGFSERGFGILENGRLLAVVPLHFQPGNRSAASSGWGGAGPILRHDLSIKERHRVLRAATKHMIEIAQEDHATRLEVSSSPVTKSTLHNRWGVDPFITQGFEDRSRLSQVILLDQDEAALWSGLSKTARHLIRRGKKAGFQVQQVDWTTSLGTYYDVHVETYRRTGVSPHPREYFEGIVSQISSSSAVRLLQLTSPGGEPVAFQNLATFGIGAHYHTSCSRNAVQTLSPGYLLMWEAIKVAKAEGFTWFDVGWIFPAARDPKQLGLTHFKTRFGGDAHRSFCAVLELASERSEAPAKPATERLRPEAAALGVAGRIARRARRLLTSGAIA